MDKKAELSLYPLLKKIILKIDGKNKDACNLSY